MRIIPCTLVVVLCIHDTPCLQVLALCISCRPRLPLRGCGMLSSLWIRQTQAYHAYLTPAVEYVTAPPLLTCTRETSPLEQSISRPMLPVVQPAKQINVHRSALQTHFLRGWSPHAHAQGLYSVTHGKRPGRSATWYANPQQCMRSQPCGVCGDSQAA